MLLADLLEQLGFFGLDLAGVLAFLSSGEQLASAIEELSLPLVHFYRVDGVIRGDFLDYLTTTNRPHGDSCFEFGTVGAALAH